MKYQSKYKEQIDQANEAYLNREPFVFDVNEDGLYDQLKDQYVSQGKMAMMDTMGQAADLTGGYGSSYAQQVGQQAYQGYLQGLNDVVPELYQMALDKYTREGDAMKDKIALLTAQDDRDYERYLDEVEQQRIAQEQSAKASQQAREDLLERAEFLASMGDYSGYQELYGLSDSEMQQWLAIVENQNKSLTDKTLDKINGRYNQVPVSAKTSPFASEEEAAKYNSRPTTAEILNGAIRANTAADAQERLGYKETDSEATQLFKASVMTKSEYRRKGEHGTYNDYLEAQLDEWLSAGKINADEAATLIAYYGL